MPDRTCNGLLCFAVNRFLNVRLLLIWLQSLRFVPITSVCWHFVLVAARRFPASVARHRGGSMAQCPPRRRKITFAEMRGSGLRGLLIYCSDYHCSRSFEISADRWPDDIRSGASVYLRGLVIFRYGPKATTPRNASPFLYAGKILQMPPDAVLRPHARIYFKPPLKPEDID
jgi:hypothetical protein